MSAAWGYSVRPWRRRSFANGALEPERSVHIKGAPLALFQTEIDQVSELTPANADLHWPLGGHVSFTIKEWWARPPVESVLERQGVVLAGYHYTAQSATGQRRHCFDPVRHGEAPAHVHPSGDSELYREGPIDVAEALAELEQRLAEELVAEAGSLFDGDEDDVDEIFGESDD